MTTHLTTMSPGYAARSDVGLHRSENEDRYLVRPPVFAVADGLGGQEAGEVAAAMAVEIIERAIDRDDGARLDTVLQAANKAILDAAESDGQAGMATTCTAIRFDGAVAHIGHIGDSRAYRHRRGRLEQLTNDHTLVAEMIREGVVGEGDASHDARRHVLTQALGSERRVHIDALDVDVEPGDRFLLCSDGLSGQVRDAEIALILSRDGDPGLAADRLIERANQAGGVDNVTVVIVDPDRVPTADQSGVPATTRPRSRRVSLAIPVLVAALAVVVLLAAILFGMLRGPTGPAQSPAVQSAIPTTSGAAPSRPSLEPPPPSAPPS